MKITNHPCIICPTFRLSPELCPDWNSQKKVRKCSVLNLKDMGILPMKEEIDYSKISHKRDCSLRKGIKCYPACLLESLKSLFDRKDKVSPGCFVCGKIKVIISIEP